MNYVYALYSVKYNRIYVGITTDVKRRIVEHNSGKEKSTKFYVPWKVFHIEKFDDRAEARSREKRLKTSFGRGFLREILKNTRL